MSALDTVDLHDARYVRRAAGTCAPSTRRECWPPPTSTSPSASRSSHRRRTRTRCSRPRWPSAHPDSDRSASTSPRSLPPQLPTSTRRRPAGAAVAGTEAWVGGLPRARWSPPARRAGRTGRSASSARRSTSTATGGTNAPSPPTSSPATSPRAASTRPCSPTDWHGCSTETSPTSSASPRRRCVLRRLAVVGGGPGTGKTTTVTRILVLLDEQAEAAGEPTPLVALAAPTGKAAARLEEAVHEEASTLELSEPERRDCWRRGRRPSTGCSADAPAAPTASGTIAATNCRTTSSSSTRPRWCRSR